MDEAGCGPWAGPLVVGAVSFDSRFVKDDCPFKIDDSKKLSPLQREKAYDFIVNHSQINQGIGIVKPDELDQLGLGKALSVAFNRAYDSLPFRALSAFVDGIRDPKLNCETYLIKGGDKLCYGISMASIIAKVTRDRMMLDLHEQFPMYKWDKNKGYGTQDHSAALKEFGISSYHRKSYKPIQEMMKFH
ncbi:MAG: ribonuclease HII [Candidatus Puniceispirillum sp.]|nr:ribonuclease HII [Candidatus Pelagibacter sp.]MBA4282734.1 ribonuclease HII [Candidatus Puniceispirillum sp.]